MTLVERFLLMFDDHREAIERAQRAEDDVLRERGLREDAQRELKTLAERWIEREREITDRMMRIRHGDRSVLTPEQIAAGLGAVEPANREKKTSLTAQAWQREARATALKTFDEFVAKVDGQRTA